MKSSADFDKPDDQAALMQYLHGENFADLAELFRIDSRRRLMALRTACAAGDLQKVAKTAHAFNGSCVSMGAKRLGWLCEEFERQCRSGRLDDWQSRLDAIDGEYASLQEAMHRILAGNPDASR